MPKLICKWNSVPKLTLGAEVHRLMSKLFRAEVTLAEHRLHQARRILGDSDVGDIVMLVIL